MSEITGRNVAKPAALITTEPLMTEHRLILPTIVANPLSLSAVPVR